MCLMCPFILQEPYLRDLIKLDPMTRIKPDKDVQPTGQFEIYRASKTISAIYSPEGALIIKAITKETSGNNVFIADLGTQENMQAIRTLDARLPPWLAQETTISEMRQD